MAAVSTTKPDSVPASRSLELDDCLYELQSYECPSCNQTHYRITRRSGAFFSAYMPPEGFTEADFGEFAALVHQNMSFDRRQIIWETRCLIDDHMTKRGMPTDGRYAAQLVDYARLRLQHLHRLGLLEKLQQASPADASTEALVIAFELGYSASELRLKDDFEAAILEGLKLQEGRHVGRETALKMKERQTKRTREAIRRAAMTAYATHPDLTRNDAATARAIERLQLPELCRHSRSIRPDAIVKHLRALRTEGKLQGIF